MWGTWRYVSTQWRQGSSTAERTTIVWGCTVSVFGLFPHCTEQFQHLQHTIHPYIHYVDPKVYQNDYKTWNRQVINYNRHFTFMLPCIVIDFFLNNQPDALIIQILFCYKTLHVSGIFSAHHQEFSTAHSALVSFMQVFDDGFQAESGCFILTVLGYGHQKPAWNLSVPNVQ